MGKKTTVSVNFKGVEGKLPRVKPGEYLAEVAEVSKEPGDKAPYLHWIFTLDEGGRADLNTSLSKKALWNLRGLLEAMGEDVPDDEMDIDLEEMVGKRIGLVIEEEEYEGKKRPKVVDFYPEDGSSSEDKDEDSGKKKKKKKKKSESLKREEVEDMDRDDLLRLNEEHDLELDEDEFSDNKKGNKKLLAAVLEKLDEKDLLEGDDAEESNDDEGLTEEKIEAMDEDELADVVKDNKLKVDLDDFKTLGKKAKAVIASLEKKGLLKD